MAELHDDRPIAEIEALRAPARTDAARRQACERILGAAEPLLAMRRQPVSSWDVLAAWARPGLIAASVALIVAAGALLSGRVGEERLEPVALGEVLASSEGGEIPALLVAINEPDAEAVAAAALMAGDGNNGSLQDNANSGRGQ